MNYNNSSKLIWIIINHLITTTSRNVSWMTCTTGSGGINNRWITNELNYFQMNYLENFESVGQGPNLFSGAENQRPLLTKGRILDDVVAVALLNRLSINNNIQLNSNLFRSILITVDFLSIIDYITNQLMMKKNCYLNKINLKFKCNSKCIDRDFFSIKSISTSAGIEREILNLQICSAYH